MERQALLVSLAVGFVLQRAGARLMLAESCTGGLASSWLTELAGSSHWFDGAVVSYANAVKADALKVRPTTLRQFGAVSAETALEMAQGVRRQHKKALVGFHAHPQAVLVSGAVTGVAGPTGGSAQKPVGTVFFAWAGPWGADSEQKTFVGNRQEIRRQATYYLLCGIFIRLSGR